MEPRLVRCSALLALVLAACLEGGRSFAPHPIRSTGRVSPQDVLPTTRRLSTELFAKKKKRRRKDQPASKSGPAVSASSPAPAKVAPAPQTAPPPLPDPVKTSLEKIEGIDNALGEEEEPIELSEDDLTQIANVAKFEYKPTDTLDPPPKVIPSVPDVAAPVDTTASSPSSSEGAIPLPDIRQARQKKAREEQMARLEQEQEEQRVKIKRSDSEAFRKLLEQQPFADADDSFFEEEAYGTVSALLGEKAKPFLGIPFGPLQIGHFIGALGILLMAFVEYPGFPLTNLPTPLREALQGGLGAIYLINIVLAVAAAFQAGSRGQPKGLWVAKTLAVGGLAYDQLTQLPTLEEIERAKNVKGARAPKKGKKK